MWSEWWTFSADRFIGNRSLKLHQPSALSWKDAGTESSGLNHDIMQGVTDPAHSTVSRQRQFFFFFLCFSLPDLEIAAFILPTSTRSKRWQYTNKDWAVR